MLELKYMNKVICHMLIFGFKLLLQSIYLLVTETCQTRIVLSEYPANSV